jgi:hypothetical protein
MAGHSELEMVKDRRRSPLGTRPGAITKSGLLGKELPGGQRRWYRGAERLVLRWARVVIPAGIPGVTCQTSTHMVEVFLLEQHSVTKSSHVMDVTHV